MGLPGRPEAKTLKVLPKGGSLAFQKRQPAGAAKEGAPELWARGKLRGGGGVWWMCLSCSCRPHVASALGGEATKGTIHSFIPPAGPPPPCPGLAHQGPDPKALRV